MSQDFFFEKVIQPGQTGIVRITIRSLTTLGVYANTFKLYTNDLRKRVIELHLRATVKPLPDYVKRVKKINLNQGETVGSFTVWPGTTPSVVLEKNERFRVSFRIRPTFKEEFELTLPPDSPERAKATLRREENGSGYWLDIDADPAAEAGVRNLKVEVQSSGRRFEVIPIYLSVQILGESIVFTPEVMDCGSIPRPSLKDFPTRVGRAGIRKLAGAFKIKSLTSTLPFLQVEAQTIVDNSNYMIRVNSAPTNLPKAGAYEGKVIVETDDAKQPRIEIPLKIVLTEK